MDEDLVTSKFSHRNEKISETGKKFMAGLLKDKRYNLEKFQKLEDKTFEDSVFCFLRGQSSQIDWKAFENKVR